jgi:hypothetical protein
VVARSILEIRLQQDQVSALIHARQNVTVNTWRSSSTNALSFLSARTMKRLPSPQWASATKCLDIYDALRLKNVCSPKRKQSESGFWPSD